MRIVSDKLEKLVLSLNYFTNLSFSHTHLASHHVTGSHSEDHEDEEAYDERSPPDRDGRDSQEYVHPSEEDDQGADRVAHRTPLHEERR